MNTNDWLELGTGAVIGIGVMLLVGMASQDPPAFSVCGQKEFAANALTQARFEREVVDKVTDEEVEGLWASIHEESVVRVANMCEGRGE